MKNFYSLDKIHLRFRMFFKRKFFYKNGTVRVKRWYLFGIPFLQRVVCIDNKSVKKEFTFFPGKNIVSKLLFHQKNGPKTICYLKVNRVDGTTLTCVQRWLDVAYFLNADIYFICDDKKLENLIKTNLKFENLNFVFFLKSWRAKIKKEIPLQNIASKVWYMAAYAHLTSFFHARENNIKCFWNIDADDTMFLEKPSMIASFMRKLAEYAEENDKEILSLDMHWSKTNKRNWTYGVCYVRKPENLINSAKEMKSFEWTKRYGNDFSGMSNIDVFTQYLMDNGNKKIGVFYFENTYFMHMPGYLSDIRYSFWHWQNGKISNPIFLNIFKDKRIGQFSIADDCIKIDLGFKGQEMLDYTFFQMFGLYMRPKADFDYYTNIREKNIEPIL